jgi:SAM-dependent methyltransferase
MAQFIDSLPLRAGYGILDMGCGYGKNLRLLKKKGLKALGVDISKSIVEVNLADGLNCMTVEEWEKTSESYELIIMSHVIEHFPPRDLMNFMNHCLSRLKTGGYLIIATPLLSKVFFHDFDHIRPYPPQAIDQMFIRDNPQAQFHSKYKLELMDVRTRRRVIRLSPMTAFSLRRNWPRFEKFIVGVFNWVYRLSRGFIGQTDGWIGLYRNLGPRTISSEISNMTG